MLHLSPNDLQELNTMIAEFRHRDAVAIIDWINKKLAMQMQPKSMSPREPAAPPQIVKEKAA